jgi:hypothetical protein
MCFESTAMNTVIARGKIAKPRTCFRIFEPQPVAFQLGHISGLYQQSLIIAE